MRRLREPDNATPAKTRCARSSDAKFWQASRCGPGFTSKNFPTARARWYTSTTGREALPGWGTSRLKTTSAQRERRIVEG